MIFNNHGHVIKLGGVVTLNFFARFAHTSLPYYTQPPLPLNPGYAPVHISKSEGLTHLAASFIEQDLHTAFLSNFGTIIFSALAKSWSPNTVV